MKILFPIIALATTVSFEALAATYYVSPSGNDSNSGASENQPFRTFNRAFGVLSPGDTLIVLDGVYTCAAGCPDGTVLSPSRSGTAGNPITIRAKNEGRAIIDGEYANKPVFLWRTEYIVIEGLVARNAATNSIGSVYEISGGNHNIIRRSVGYNASNAQNSSVFSVTNGGQYNLFEDNAAWGTGRKMFVFFASDHNTMRRCFARWERWDGTAFCDQAWPNGVNLEVYGGNYNTIENSIAYGPVPGWGSIYVFAQGNVPSAIGNRILGTMALRAGKDDNGNRVNYGSRPPPCSQVSTPNPHGFLTEGSDGHPSQDNVWRDILSWNNGASGFRALGRVVNCQIDRATILSNNPNLNDTNLCQVSNSTIEGTSHAGEGARLRTRYVDGTLTNQPLWPWPMEARIQEELGISVTGIVGSIVDIGSTPARDAGVVDSGTRDAGARDSGAQDAATRDSGVDARVRDSGTGGPDASVNDSGGSSRDAGVRPDTGSSADAGQVKDSGSGSSLDAGASATDTGTGSGIDPVDISGCTCLGGNETSFPGLALSTMALFLISRRRKRGQ